MSRQPCGEEKRWGVSVRERGRSVAQRVPSELCSGVFVTLVAWDQFGVVALTALVSRSLPLSGLPPLVSLCVACAELLLSPCVFWLWLVRRNKKEREEKSKRLKK